MVERAGARPHILRVYQEILRSDVTVDPFDLEATVARQRLGRFDPTGRGTPAEFLKVHIGASGTPVAWRLSHARGGVRVEAQGADRAHFAAFVARFPPADGAEDFCPGHPVVRRLARLRGLRLLRYPWPFDVAAGFILQQRVRWRVGYGDFRNVVLRWGTRTPAGIAFPGADRLAAVPPWRLEAMGIDAKRARALIGLSRAQARDRFLHPEACPEEIGARLRRIPGIGPWTVGMVLGYAYGESDAVPTGDLHIPSLVTSALAGEPEGSDERMLELLEPFRGHRFRVIRLLQWAARRAPHVLDHRAYRQPAHRIDDS